MIHIRPATEVDFAPLLQVQQLAFGEYAHVYKVSGWTTETLDSLKEDAKEKHIFVAEENGKVFGYITTQVDREAGKGRIPNLAVDAAAQGHGLGRKLIEHALDYFRAEGLAAAVIETMANNARGQHLYPSCGFVETCRQIHFAMKL